MNILFQVIDVENKLIILKFLLCVLGQKADLMDIKNVDWIPTVNMTSTNRENTVYENKVIDSKEEFKNEIDNFKRCNVSNCLTNSILDPNVKFYKFPTRTR